MKRKKVLLLGDSISLGYRNIVKYKLKKCCEVKYPVEQGKFAADVYRMLYEWKKYVAADSDIDLVYWNAGLWDVVHIFGEESQTGIEIYKEYLEKIYYRLRKIFPEAKICFATTTPIIEERYSEEFYRKNRDIELYNEAAFSVLGNKVDLYDDLYSLMHGINVRNYKDATHFTYAANCKLANHIIQNIISFFEEDINKLVRKERNRIDNLNGKLEQIITSKKAIAAWGAGNIFNEIKELIGTFGNLIALVDKDRRLQGANIHGVRCIAPDAIVKDISLVVVTVNSIATQYQIGEYCDAQNVLWCTYEEFLEYAWSEYEKEQLENDNYIECDSDPKIELEMKKYIGISIPENICNLDCEYCYLRTNQNRRFENIGKRNPHNPKFIRKQLSRKKLGGSCLIGLTASGETLLADKFTEICLELLKEGHYLHIVTNGTIVDKVADILEKTGLYAKHMIFKLSFHYIQLKEKGLLDKFVETVRLIEQSEASYTIEIMPHDELEPYIQEVIEFSMKNFGALPQLTIGRDEHDDMKLLTNNSFSEYYNTWKVFDSNMFEMRMKLYLTKGKNCAAGDLSFFVDLYSGRIDRCVYYENAGNLYLDDNAISKMNKVGDLCPMVSCYNCHVYAPFGILPIKDVPTYYAIRERKKKDGIEWIKADMKRYLSTKLDGGV